MASLKHEITHFANRVKKARGYIAQHLNLKEHAKTDNQNLPKQRMPSEPTLNQHLTHAVKFGEWCKSTYRVRHWDECKPYIQEYVDSLVAKGLSASTIHTYVAGVCFVWDVPMSEIRKPTRHASDATRSRGIKVSDKRKDRQRSVENSRFNDLGERLGLRRHELAVLRGSDLAKDESGYLCVFVRKGKGGKRQKQRILPQDIDFVKSFFDGTDNYIFTKSETTNKLDIHHYRHLQAQRAYDYYYNRLQIDPGYRERLTTEIRRRWETFNRKQWDPKCVKGTIKLRGSNRTFAEEHNLPIQYDRLACMATSVFHLSHWRTNVAVSPYLLAFSAE